MNPSSSFVIVRDMPGSSSRSNARKALKRVLEMLNESAVVEIDMTNALVTPSLADGLVGNLALHLGREAFKQRVRVFGYNEDAKVLLNHVCKVRLAERRAASVPHP